MSDHDAVFDDILQAFYQLRKAFIKNNMKPPISIELGCQKDADYLRYAMPKDLFLAQPRMGDTKQDAERVANILGIELRLPAQWRRDQRGKDHLL